MVWHKWKRMFPSGLECPRAPRRLTLGRVREKCLRGGNVSRANSGRKTKNFRVDGKMMEQQRQPAY